MQILIIEPDNYSLKALEIYGQLGKVWLGEVPVEMRAEVSLLVVRLAHRLDNRILSHYPGLRAIASPTTGLTHIDLDACRGKGIRIFSLGDVRQAIETVTSTSELTFGLLIALLRRISLAHHDVASGGHWQRDRFRSRQMNRLTLGIIGVGRIGGHISGYARAFGMRILACDPYQPQSRFEALGIERRDQESLLADADIITIHANLRDDNRLLIDGAAIRRMRPGTLLINTARGELLEETAAADALRAGQLGGVAIDVLAGEQTGTPWISSPLVRAAQEGFNVIITPHIGGCTSDAMHITEEHLAQYVVHVVKGESWPK